MSKVCILDNIPKGHVGGMNTYKEQFIKGLESANIEYNINDVTDCGKIVVLSHVHPIFDCIEFSLLLNHMMTYKVQVYVIVHSVDDMVDKNIRVLFRELHDNYVNSINLVLYRDSYNNDKLNEFLDSMPIEFNTIINNMMHSDETHFKLPSQSDYSNLAWLGRLVDAHNLYSRIIMTPAVNCTMYFSTEGIFENDVAMVKSTPHIYSDMNKSYSSIISELNNFRIGIVTADYKDNGFPLTHAINDMIMCGVVPLIPKSVASKIHEKDPYLILPSFDDGYRFQPIKELESLYKQLMSNKLRLDYIARTNYDRMVYKYKPEYNVKQILGV